jgi:glyoxylase-like metal-dependent hydrolase (beta-lactamase superfamily II)/predicted ester cyclase
MATTADIARRYFAALSAHDLDAALACWAPGAIDRLVGGRDLVAPEGIREYFGSLFEAFPDFTLEVVELTTYRGRTAVRWRARGTFAGPGRFMDFLPNGARLELEGCDVVSVEGDLIRHNDAYLDTGDIARQLGVLPPAGSTAEARLTRLANMRTRAREMIHGAEPEPIADGVWVLRGGFPLKTMNVYLIEDGDGVTVFDAGIEAMGTALRAACARLGGASRVVLGHADCDHRGAAPFLGAPTYCHPAEQAAAAAQTPYRDYWNLAKLDLHGRVLLGRLLPTWDGGAVPVAGTITEGDEVAGFRVLDLPGHAPGLIGLYRESDRLALVSDCFYTLDPQTGKKGGPRVPHPAFDVDVEQARASIRKVANLEPRIAWAGHADPVSGDVKAQLHQAASAPV